jgi:hypothetical protein
MVLGKSLRNNFMDLKTSQGYDLSASYHQPGITGEPPADLQQRFDSPKRKDFSSKTDLSFNIPCTGPSTMIPSFSVFKPRNKAIQLETKILGSKHVSSVFSIILWQTWLAERSPI